MTRTEISAHEARLVSDELVRKLCQRDSKAWDSFLTEHQDFFRRATCAAAQRRPSVDRLLRNGPMDDTLHHVMAYCCEHFPARFQEYRSSTETWAYLTRMVEHALLELARANRPVLPLEAADESGLISPRDDASRGEIDEKLEALRACILELDRACRVIIDRHWRMKESLAKIAERLGVGGEAVKKRHQRAVAQLRECIRRRLSSAAGEA